jgi:hypothetical protein
MQPFRPGKPRRPFTADDDLPLVAADEDAQHRALKDAGPIHGE